MLWSLQRLTIIATLDRSGSSRFKNALPYGRILWYVGGIQGCYKAENKRGEDAAVATQRKEKTWRSRNYNERLLVI